MAQDKAIRAIVRLCNLWHASGVRIVLCSGRPERYRKQTVAWLARGRALRRTAAAPRRRRHSDTVAKRGLLADLDPSQVLFVVEDRSGVVEMWRQAGYVCLQCAPGEF